MTPEPTSTLERVTIRSSGGVELDGEFCRALSADRRKSVAVLFLHGFPSADVWADKIGCDMGELCQRISGDHEWNALTVRFRGCGESYGIPNCDSCRKARKWLDGFSVAYRFHDLRTDGIDAKRLRAWQKSVDWQKLLNTRSTTWRGLPETEKRNVDAERAVTLMVQHPTLIKRPVLETGQSVLVGFSSEHYAAQVDA